MRGGMGTQVQEKCDRRQAHIHAGNDQANHVGGDKTERSGRSAMMLTSTLLIAASAQPSQQRRPIRMVEVIVKKQEM